MATPQDLFNRDELRIAATWWAKTMLSNFVDDNGDFVSNAFVASMRGKRHPWDIPAERNVIKFKETLIALMAVNFCEGWDEKQPNFGSANRTLSFDYGPCPILRCALDFASIPSTLTLPVKTVMWVSPKSVTVRQGYNGVEEKLMES